MDISDDQSTALGTSSGSSVTSGGGSGSSGSSGGRAVLSTADDGYGDDYTEEEAAKADDEAAYRTAEWAATPDATAEGGADPFHGFRRRLASLKQGRPSPSLSRLEGVSSSSSSSDGAPDAPDTVSADADADAAVPSSPSHEQCVALFMDMDMVTSLPGRPFILGIPWLRAFVAKFNRDTRTIGLAQVPVGSSYCASCAATDLSAGVATASANATAPTSVARVSTLASKALGAASFAAADVAAADVAATGSKGGGGGAVLMPSAGPPSHAEARAAHLEGTSSLISTGSNVVTTQVVTEHTVMLGSRSAATVAAAGAAGVHGAHGAHAAHSPLRMKLGQLRVPMWLQQAHGEWHKENNKQHARAEAEARRAAE